MVAVPTTVLIAGGAFGPALSAERVVAAIDRGLRSGGLPPADPCPLRPDADRGEDLRALLDGLDFDARMRRARAVVIAVEALSPRSLLGSPAFEIATRARQGGVPAYALTGESTLSPFDARILDLQLILTARTLRALTAAAARLAAVV
jgi:hypothetical protein